MKDRAGLYASRALFVYFACVSFSVSIFSSSWCRGLAAACDCGTPLTFLLTFFARVCQIKSSNLFQYLSRIRNLEDNYFLFIFLFPASIDNSRGLFRAFLSRTSN